MKKRVRSFNFIENPLGILYIFLLCRYIPTIHLFLDLMQPGQTLSLTEAGKRLLSDTSPKKTMVSTTPKLQTVQIKKDRTRSTQVIINKSSRCYFLLYPEIWVGNLRIRSGQRQYKNNLQPSYYSKNTKFISCGYYLPIRSSVLTSF